MSMSTRRHLLRDRTSSAHAALDETVGELASLAHYRRYLRGLHAFRLPAERLVSDGLAADSGAGLASGWQPTAIAGMMLSDMADLGVSPVAPIRLAPPAGLSGLVGLVYVLEGSALGARLLRRQAERLGLGPDHGARHLAAQAESLDAWRGFLAALDSLPDFDETAAIAGAEAAFAAALAAFASLDCGAGAAARG